MEKRFIKDYELDENGSGLIYKGKEYLIEASPGIKKKAAAFAITKAALFIGMFLTGDNATRLPPVGIPFILMIISIPLFCYNIPRFTRLPFPMERRHYEGVFTHIGIYSGVNFLLSAAACVAFFFCVPNINNISRYEYLFPVLSLGIAALSFLFFKDWINMQKKSRR